jgi:protocatechuate 3,4-dioxygenase beta subunit
MRFLPLIITLPLLTAAQTQGSIEGIATNKLTKIPIAGVRVHMTAISDRTINFDTVTDGAGAYRIENVPPGEYSPSFDTPKGFVPQDPLKFLGKQPRVQVTDDTAKYDFEIIPASAISGRLLDPDGNPVPNATITAVPIGGLLPGMAQTDSQGRYFMSVAPGKYRVQARSAPGKWPPTYYPGETDPASAEVIKVREGAQVGGYDIRFRPPSNHYLRGIVRDNAGKPAPGVEVTVQPSAGLIEQLAKAKSDADGVFELKPVPPGNWQIISRISHDGVPWFGTARVIMSDRDLDSVDLRIDPPFTVPLDVQGAPDQLPNILRFELQVLDASTHQMATGRDGVYRFDGLYPGPYRLRLYGAMPGHYVKAVLLGAQDVAGRPFDLGPESPALHVIYAPNAGRIVGEVENGANAKVILIYADRDNYISGTDAFIIHCTAEGRFVMPDLRPGVWLALAFSDINGTLTHPDIREIVFGRGFWRQADTFEVTEGQVTSLRLKLLPWTE